jgi:hypothetical protein
MPKTLMKPIDLVLDLSNNISSSGLSGTSNLLPVYNLILPTDTKTLKQRSLEQICY